MTIANGNTVKVHYLGTLEDGTQFDSSYDRGEPIQFTVGAGAMISGFEDGLLGMGVGEKKDLTLGPDQAYGQVNEAAIQVVPRDQFPEDFQFIDGAMLQGQDPQGQPFMAKISGLTDDTVTLDMNHPLAGQTLNFQVEVVEIS